MRKTDTTDVLATVGAVIGDTCAVFGGFMLATWVRFDTGWIPLRHARPEALYRLYATGAVAATVVFLLVFRSLGLYARPQMGTFVNKIPRLVRGCGIGILLTTVLAFSVQNEAEFSRLTIGTALFTISFLLLVQRYGLYRAEWNIARHSRRTHNVLILGVDAVAARLRRSLRREPMLRARVAGFVPMDGTPADPAIADEDIVGTPDDIPDLVAAKRVSQVILTNPDVGRGRILDLVLLCERQLVTFNMVPDLFRIMTSSMDVQSLDDIPLLGLRRWPLEVVWNRILKRIEDIVGAALGLVLTAPLIAVAGCFIKQASAGPVFYSQERCGRSGKPFRILKLRTMRVDAEAGTGPVFAEAEDPRTTPVGAFLRRHNLDELPQLWNVLKGEMSLVGPRPERPHFVEKFREDIGRYMWRHVSKPGVTGWAQVNGLRGNTSIGERVKYDLYYLEHWSLAFDFKILVRTLTAQKNAY